MIGMIFTLIFVLIEIRKTLLIFEFPLVFNFTTIGKCILQLKQFLFYYISDFNVKCLIK